jgi:hypothetical protein
MSNENQEYKSGYAAGFLDAIVSDGTEEYNDTPRDPIPDPKVYCDIKAAATMLGRSVAMTRQYASSGLLGTHKEANRKHYYRLEAVKEYKKVLDAKPAAQSATKQQRQVNRIYRSAECLIGVVKRVKLQENDRKVILQFLIAVKAAAEQRSNRYGKDQ